LFTIAVLGGHQFTHHAVGTQSLTAGFFVSQQQLLSIGSQFFITVHIAIVIISQHAHRF